MKVLRPTVFYMNGFLICPDCGTVKWGTFVCSCGARVLGPRKRGHYIDETRHNWLVSEDGTAVLWKSEQ